MPLVSVPGARLHVLERGRGEVVLVLASMLVLARTYAPLVRRLSRRFRTLVVELPGSGRSSRVRGAWTAEASARAALSLLDALGVERAHVVGHSNSGPAAIELALLAPGRVAGLVLCDIVGANPGDSLPRILAARAVDALQEPVLTIRGAAHVAENAARHPRALLGEVRRAARADVLERAGRIAVPTLVAWGRRSVTLPPVCAARLAARIAGAQLAFGAGGHDWLVTHPREFSALVEGFARPVPAVPSPSGEDTPGMLLRVIRGLAALGPRSPVDAEGHRRVGEAAHLVASDLRRLGHEPRAQWYHARGRPVANVEVEIPGSDRSGETVVVGAHYDTAARTPGAAEDASGVAALVALAGALRGIVVPRTIRLVWFCTEEPPFTGTRWMGSRVHARRCRRAGEEVIAMLSLETLGRADRVLVVSNLRSRTLARTIASALRPDLRADALPAPGFLPLVRSSGQGSYWKEGFRAVAITDGGPLRHRQYPRPGDRPEAVDAVALARLSGALARVVVQLAER
jgi:pimeloyl-ACP methyl ester carboxylesterase